MLKLYPELLGDVRNDDQYYPIRALVQPDDPEVRELAFVLEQDRDFVSAAHQFVHAFTTYKREIGDIWRTPAESLLERELDCDCSAILLCSILRNYIPAEKVFVAIGAWLDGKKADGHAWVVMEDWNGQDRILESTADWDAPVHGRYQLAALFNDQYAFSTRAGLVEFGLRPDGRGWGLHLAPQDILS
ncbi:MAG: hypothetical protein Q8R28_09810 [Dehalococcoidia bacterium]|nr:hypothetical protein [Dehalococcoidia bacterium]